MINVNDVVPTTPANIYRYEVVNADGSSKNPVEYMYLKFAPGTLALTPTAVNRATLMAMQGFISQTTVFNEDGSVTETNAEGHTLVTTFPSETVTVETFTAGTQVITLTTTVNADGSVSEEAVM